MISKKSLSNIRVLVTRPIAQAEKLCQRITQHDGNAIALPTVMITPIEPDTDLKQTIQTLDEIDFLIFVSPNAVTMTAPLIHDLWPQLPPQLTCIALGPGTRDALLQHNFSVVLMPEAPFNSESVLKLTQLQPPQIHGKKVIIVCAPDGRNLLVEQLSARGAEVKCSYAYRRMLPQYDPALVRQYFTTGIDVILCTSVSCMQNLQKLVAPDLHSVLYQTPILVISRRMVTVAAELGYSKVLLADGASDDAIIATLLEEYGT